MPIQYNGRDYGDNTLNAGIGISRDTRMNRLQAVMASEDMSVGEKTTALLDAQGALGITDGVQNLAAKAYNRWSQTGQ